MKSKTIYIFIFIICFSFLKGQTIAITEYNGIVFEKGENNEAKENYALLCSDYIKSNYPRKSLPLIYLVISNDSLQYELAYDNLQGNSLDNKTYGRKGKYYEPGIRIKVPDSPNQSQAILDLLNYGIKNLSELKKIRKKAMKLDYYDRPDNLSLPKEEISKILGD